MPMMLNLMSEKINMMR